MRWNLSKSPPRWKVHRGGLCRSVQTQPKGSLTSPPFTRNKSETVQARHLMSPCLQVLSCGRSWAGLRDWGGCCWRLITMLGCWHFSMVDPSAGSAPSHPPSVAFKRLCCIQDRIKAAKERYRIFVRLWLFKHINTLVIISESLWLFLVETRQKLFLLFLKWNKNHNLT